MSKFLLNTAAAALLLAAPAAAQEYGLGREAHPDEIAAWDVKVFPDGRGLPEGSGSVLDGEDLFSMYCAACHGEFGEGVDNWPAVAGGEGTLDHDRPDKTVGSYWPYLSTVWDYINRSMPFGNAQTLTDDEVYAITAYILYSNYLVDDDFVLTHENFTEIEMPNADGFIVDDRPETEYPLFTAEPCMSDCKDEAEITMRAAVLDVTPGTAEPGEVETTAPVEAMPMDDSVEAPTGTTDEAPQEADADVPEDAEAEAEAEAPSDAEAEAPAEDAETPAEGAEAADEQQAAAAAEPDPALIAEGERAFNKCRACHMIGEGATNRVGPRLTGIIDAPFAHVDDFNFSPAIRSAAEEGKIWSEDNLRAFLSDPRGFLPGNRMTFAGIRSESEMDALLAYLASHQ